MRASEWVFVVGFVVYVGIRHVYQERVKGQPHDVRRVDGLEQGLMVLVALGSLLLPVLYLATPLLAFADRVVPDAASWVGGAVMLGAVWLFWRAHADLGLHWSISLELRPDHRLITTGVYRSVRHPMYAAILLWCIAQGLLLHNWLAGWSGLVTFALLCLIRTPREERMLRERFGDEYREYMRRTGRLLPRLR